LSFLRTAKIKVARRDGDPSTLIASDKKAKKELNLSPDYACL
jgi:UDP-glucose 4-epimerase